MKLNLWIKESQKVWQINKKVKYCKLIYIKEMIINKSQIKELNSIKFYMKNF